MWSFAEHVVQSHEPGQGPRSEALHIMCDAFERLFNGESGEIFAVEIVCVTDEFFFERFGQQIFRFERQVFCADLVGGKSGADVSFTDACGSCVAAWINRAEVFGAQFAVFHVGFGAEAEDRGRVAPYDAAVVEHAGFVQKGVVYCVCELA